MATGDTWIGCFPHDFDSITLDHLTCLRGWSVTSPVIEYDSDRGKLTISIKYEPLTGGVPRDLSASWCVSCKQELSEAAMTIFHEIERRLGHE